VGSKTEKAIHRRTFGSRFNRPEGRRAVAAIRRRTRRGFGLQAAQHPGKGLLPANCRSTRAFLEPDRDAREAKTIVHCEGGSGRTGTFAAAYWVAKGLKVSDAIARVREARRHAVETREQEAALRDFAAKHRGSV
jgi:hypothetical protein